MNYDVLMWRFKRAASAVRGHGRCEDFRPPLVFHVYWQ